MLAGTGTWRLVETGRVSPFERIEVFTDEGPEAIAFDAAEAGLAHLACIVENDLVAAAARERLDELADFHVLAPAALAEMRRADELTEVITTTGDTLACRLLVAADGADSTVRRPAGIGRDVFDYRQQAVVARVVPERHHGATARQKFPATGPLAFLPLADGSCSVVWSPDNENAAGVMSLDDAAFAHRLEREFDGRLGRILECERRYAFALRRAHARRYYADGVALVGDACHTRPPAGGPGRQPGHRRCRRPRRRRQPRPRRRPALLRRARAGRLPAPAPSCQPRRAGGHGPVSPRLRGRTIPAGGTCGSTAAARRRQRHGEALLHPARRGTGTLRGADAAG
ncbi:MAG: FAD-dependent monooxygenase [Gammaproteobacteria bacterium]|nr:FAD-dependent monooxygenase [Gammaproteobacteria bacterium]